MRISNRRLALLLAAAAAVGTGAAVTAQPALEGQPGIPYSGAKPDSQNQAVLDALTKLNLRAYHTLTPQDARRQPSFADGVKAVVNEQRRPNVPVPGINAVDVDIDGAAGPLKGKLYRPGGVAGALPVIVYFHGGGWVLASPEVYDSSARGLSNATGAIVVSVDYRLAPEFKFPAQHDDALASYRWAIANAAKIGGDPARIALAGESAGGNLAVATAIAARDAGLQAPRHVLAVYPIAGNDLNTPSYRDSGNAMPLNRAGMAWFFHHATRSPADLADPRINLVAANLRGLPPTTIIAAQIDPLRSEGLTLANRLKAAGVRVTRREFPATTHEFFGGDQVITKAGAAQAFAGQQLRASLRAR